MTNSPLWFRGVRPSKFRHVYGLPSRKECCYTDISVVRNGNDGNFCAVNPKFLAIVCETTFAVISITQTGRIDYQCCKCVGHTGLILDLKWNVFNDNIIASASDDCTIRIWSIPEGGLMSNSSESLQELTGHKRKVLHIEWHPTANNVLISVGFDHLVIVWDIANSSSILNIINCHVDMIYCLAINRDGSLIATTSKDKKLRVIEPRNGIVVSENVCHQGTKCSKAVFLDNDRILTTGFSRHSDRQYCVWNQHDLRKPLVQEVIDSSSGVVTPYFDNDTKMIYLAGKGDGNIRYYETVVEAPYIYYLNQYLSGQPQKALSVMPKRGLNVVQCEVFRFYKMYAAGSICEPISMIVPRKSSLFQADLYPDTVSMNPAISAKEWFSGRNTQPILMSLQTGHPILDIPNKTVCVDVKSPTTVTNKITNGFAKKHDREINENEKLLDNNTKKFAFLSQQTVPDYRPQTISDKDSKTTSNQSTKFHQLQAIFGQQPNNKEIINLQNNLLSTTNATDSSNLISSEIELRNAYNKQTDEIKSLRKSLHNSEKRVRELELEVKRLQMHKKKSEQY